MADDVTEGVAIYIVLSYLKYLARELGLAIYQLLLHRVISWK